MTQKDADCAGASASFCGFLRFQFLGLRRWTQRSRAFLAILFGALSIAAASDPAERLADPAQEARARAIFRDTRCLVCQNESIDDSEADLARDLRGVIRGQIRAGRSDAEIRKFLTDRYGEFVLMTPTFSPWNLVLWIGPFVVVLAGGALLLLNFRNRTPEAELSEEEARRVEALSEGETHRT